MRPSGRSDALRIGLIFGVAAVYLCLVGVIETFKARWVVSDAFGLGRAILLILGLVAGFLAARRQLDCFCPPLPCRQRLALRRSPRRCHRLVDPIAK